MAEYIEASYEEYGKSWDAFPIDNTRMLAGFATFLEMRGTAAQLRNHLADLGHMTRILAFGRKGGLPSESVDQLHAFLRDAVPHVKNLIPIAERVEHVLTMNGWIVQLDRIGVPRPRIISKGRPQRLLPLMVGEAFDTLLEIDERAFGNTLRTREHIADWLRHDFLGGDLDTSPSGPIRKHLDTHLVRIKKLVGGSGDLHGSLKQSVGLAFDRLHREGKVTERNTERVRREIAELLWREFPSADLNTSPDGAIKSCLKNHLARLKWDGDPDR